MQIIVFNNINLLGYVNPYLYISFVFLYPLHKNRFLFLLLAFLYGLILDFFSDTGGIHAFSLLFIAYIRLFFVKLIFKKTEIDFPLFNLHSEMTGSIFNYVAVLTFIHHFILFSLANFRLSNFGDVILSTLYSSIFTIIVYFMASFVFIRKKGI